MALSALEVLVTNKGATANTTSLIGLVTSGFKRIVDVSEPLIPDLRSKQNLSTSATGTEANPIPPKGKKVLAN